MTSKNYYTEKRLSRLLAGILLLTNCTWTNLHAQTDACASATALTVNTSCITTAYNVASTFTDAGPALCTGTSFRDGWYTFTTDAVTNSITITGTSNRQMGLAIYSGTCAALTQVACTNPGTANASLTNIPVSPSTTYRLRITRTNNANANDMTGTICVVGSSGCSGTPSAGTTASTGNPVCSGTSFTLSLTGATSSAGITYQWQTAPDASGSPGSFTNILGATSATYVATQTTISWYRCAVTCSNSLQTAKFV